MSNPLNGRNVRVREGSWHYRFNFQGREYAGNTGLEGVASNQMAAEQIATAKRWELRRETARKQPVPFQEAAVEFLNWCRDVEYRGKPNTSARLATSFASAVEFFGDTPVQQIDAGEIERYKAFRAQVHQVRDITVRHDLHALSVFFRKYAKKQGWADQNPVEAVTIPSDRDAVREHVVSLEEEAAYFQVATTFHRQYAKSFKKALPNMADLARLMLDQGARPEELLATRKEHFDAGAGTLLIAGGKSRAARRILDLTDASLAILSARMKSPGPWLFPSDAQQGQHLTKLNGTHDRICIEAGISFVIYDFRHTFATRMVAAGVDVPTVAAIMGHSGLRTIYRYVHPTAESKKLAMKKFQAAIKRRRLKVVNG